MREDDLEKVEINARLDRFEGEFAIAYPDEEVNLTSQTRLSPKTSSRERERDFN